MILAARIRKTHPGVLLLLLGALGGILFLGELLRGSVPIPWEAAWHILLGKETGTGEWGIILRELRFPRGCTAWLGGASLGVAGLLMQTWFQNPLGGPFVLGTTAGASLGVALAVLGLPLLGGAAVPGHPGLLLLASSGGALGGLLLVLLGSRNLRNPGGVLLLGLMLGYLANAGVTVLLHYGDPRQIRSYLSWSFGTFGMVSPRELRFFVPFSLFFLLGSLGLAKPLNALLLGEVYARSMGVDPLRLRRTLFLCTASLGGGVTAFCGPVAFLGVAVPHICRGLFGTSDHRVLLPACLLGGGALGLGADILTRWGPGGSRLPLNAVTALLGVPVVLWVLFRYRRSLGEGM